MLQCPMDANLIPPKYHSDYKVKWVENAVSFVNSNKCTQTKWIRFTDKLPTLQKKNNNNNAFLT